MTMLRAELVKLLRPLSLAIVLLAAVFASLALIHLQSQGSAARANVQAFETQIQALRHGTIRAEQQDGQQVTCSWEQQYPLRSTCGTYLHQIEAAQNAQLLGQEQLLAAASLEQNPLGAGVQAGGAMASLLGFVLITILAAGHVGGEWSGRTLRPMLIRQPNRWRVFSIKVLSLWIASLAILLITWAVLAIFALAFRAISPLEPIGIAGFPASSGPSEMGRAALILAVYSTLGTTLAMIARSVVGTLTTGLAFGAGSLILGYQFTWASHHEFVYWVTGFMGWYDPRMIGTGTYWLTTFATHQYDATAPGGILGLAIGFAITALVGAVAFKRARINL